MGSPGNPLQIFLRDCWRRRRQSPGNRLHVNMVSNREDSTGHVISLPNFRHGSGGELGIPRGHHPGSARRYPPDPELSHWEPVDKPRFWRPDGLDEEEVKKFLSKCQNPGLSVTSLHPDVRPGQLLPREQAFVSPKSTRNCAYSETIQTLLADRSRRNAWSHCIFTARSQSPR